jgi:hypothetical protein
MKFLSSVILLGVGLVVSGASECAWAADAPLKSPSLAGPASVESGVVALEPDGVAFGMNSEAVARLYDRYWDKRFVPKYQKANPGPKTRELDYQLAEQKKVLRRVTRFDGRSASFDKADFKEEFAHGNAETMTSAKVARKGVGAGSKSVSYTRRFFFFQDRLWKVYDEYELDAAGLFGPDFKEATTRVGVSLGPTAKRTRGPESQWENVVFDSGNSRVRLVKLPSNRVAVVRSDNALAREVLDARAQHVQSTEAPLDEDIQAVIR